MQGQNLGVSPPLTLKEVPSRFALSEIEKLSVIGFMKVSFKSLVNCVAKFEFLKF